MGGRRGRGRDGQGGRGRGVSGRVSERKKVKEEAELLRSRIAALTSSDTDGSHSRFDALPLSAATIRGLDDGGFERMTAIQRRAIPLTLQGKDILGAAKTGSGKTLAFLVPALETLYRAQWGASDGVGVLVLTPTRELAIQIFDVLRKVGCRHSFSAALLIGGKNVKFEKENIYGKNILVCTPGRLLQHMDETPNFDCDSLMLLVLDEADRCLDMGFETALNAIISNLPKERQTLLFSATQTKSVKALSRLSLKDPEFVSVHDEASVATPNRLKQTLVVCDLNNKFNMLWSFIKSHLKGKTIVFASTCKQVQFFHEILRQMRPGVPLRCLHGNMKQLKRMVTVKEFSEAKDMVMLATDIASRGLDFPAVDWVLQVDCPEDVAQYIHRVGRTARFLSSGRAMLLVTPSERKGIVRRLEEARIPVKESKVNPHKTQSIDNAIRSLLSKDADLKKMSQMALVTYLKSIYRNKNKDIFDISKLPIEETAYSWGLPSAPRIRFLKNGEARKGKGAGNTVQASKGNGAEEEEGEEEEEEEDSEKDEHRAMSESYRKMAASVQGDDDFISLKRKDHDLDPALAFIQAKKKKRISNRNVSHNNRLVFDDEGVGRTPLEAMIAGQEEEEGQSKAWYEEAAAHIREMDKEDRARLRERLKEKRTKKKQKLRGEEKSPAVAEISIGGSYGGSDADEEVEEEEKEAKAPTKLYNIEEQEAMAMALLNM